MKNAAFSIEELFRFLDAGVSAFHSTAAASAILEAEGYVNCPESAAWELAPGGKYYTTRNGSAVLAWRMPKGELTGWHAAASHSDSPTWRIKQFDTEDKVFAKAEVEGYGGMIMPSWLDRPLTVAGRLLVRTESGIESRLVCPDRALACIPNLCIHFSRDLNNGMKYNPQVDLQPIFGGKGGNLKEVLAAEAGVKAEDILDADLVLATREKAVRMGLNGEYFMSGRIDASSAPTPPCGASCRAAAKKKAAETSGSCSTTKRSALPAVRARRVPSWPTCWPASRRAWASAGSRASAPAPTLWC